MDFAEQLGRRMRRARRERGMTQSELALAARVGANYIPRLERGELVPSVEAAYRIARALGVSLDELCSRSSNRRKAEELVQVVARLQRTDPAVLRRVADALETVTAANRASKGRRR